MARPAFPIRFATYTFPKGYDGGQIVCGHTCPQCDRTEALWRIDPTNVGTYLSTGGATIVVGAVFPWFGTTVVFPSAVVTAAQILAFMQTMQPRASAQAVA